MSMALANALPGALTIAAVAVTFWLLGRAIGDLMSGEPPPSTTRTLEMGWFGSPRYRLRLAVLALVITSLVLSATHVGHADAGVSQATSTFNGLALMGAVVAKTIDARSKWMSVFVAAFVVLLFYNAYMLFG